MRLRDIGIRGTRALSHLPHRSWIFASAALLTAAVSPIAIKSAQGKQGEAAAEVAVIALMLALALLGLGVDKLGLTRPAVLALLVGVAARVAYLFVTPYTARTHDVDQHVEYVEFLVAHHAIPKPTDGWAFYHPPSYYVLAALLWRGLQAVHARRPVLIVALQLQSLAYHLGFLVFALLTGKGWLDRLSDARLGPGSHMRARLGALFAALLCLWPSGIIHSVRIGNDDASYLAFGGLLFYASRWWQEERDRHFHAAAAFAGLAMLIKSNGLVAFALLGLLFVAYAIREEHRSIRGLLRRAWPAAVLFAVPTAATLVRSIRDVTPGHPHSLLVGNSDKLTTAIAVGNRAENYLWFDLKMLLTVPYSTSWSDEAGRQYFANFALKTSLLGDFSYDGVRLSDLAIVMSFLLVPILICVGLGAAYQTRDDWLDALPLWLMIGLSVASLAALRMSIPMACSNDFRYILPVLMPSLYLFTRALARMREMGRSGLARWGECAGWAFAAASLMFYSVLARA